MSRFQLLDMPVAIPGCCHICGSVGDGKRKFIDLGITIEFTGVIYFCTFCMSEALAIMGFIKPEQYDILNNNYNKKCVDLKESMDESARLRALVDAGNLLRANSSKPASDSSHSSIETPGKHVVDAKPGSENDNRPPKPSNGGGRKDVSDHASNDNLQF